MKNNNTNQERSKKTNHHSPKKTFAALSTLLLMATLSACGDSPENGWLSWGDTSEEAAADGEIQSTNNPITFSATSVGGMTARGRTTKNNPNGPIDLTVSSFTILSPPTLGCGSQTIAYSATETNLGTSPSGSYWLWLLTDAGQGTIPNMAASSNQRPSLAAGATRAFTGNFITWMGPCDCQPINYTVQYRLKIDGPNNITESNEANNWSNIVSRGAHCP